MCVHVHIYIYTYIHIHVYTHTCTYVYIYIYTHIHSIYIYIYTRAYSKYANCGNDTAVFASSTCTAWAAYSIHCTHVVHVPLACSHVTLKQYIYRLRESSFFTQAVHVPLRLLSALLQLSYLEYIYICHEV